MADIEKTIEIIFGAVDNSGGVISNFAGNIDSTVSNISSITNPIANLTTDLVKLETGIIAVGAAFLGFSVNEAGTFKGSINEIGALFNATSDQSEQLRQDIITFASDSVFSIDDINKATFTAISTGTEWTNVTDLLAQSQQLAVAGSTDLATSTAALTRTMNAYGFEASEAERVSNALFVAAQLGDTNLTALGNGFGNLATTASAANVELEESLAAVSAITVSGVKTAETMTILRALFRELATPSKELTIALGGVSLESDGLQGVMQKLLEVTGGTQAGMDALFSSSEAVSGAIILAKDSTGAFNNALDALEDKTGKVSAAYSNLVDDFDKQNQNLANKVSIALIKVGDDLLDEYGDITKALGNIFETLGVSVDSGALKVIIEAIEVFGQEAATLLDGIAKALPEALAGLDFGGLVGSFGALQEAVGDIFGELDLTDAEDLQKAIQFVVDSLDSLTRFVVGVVEAWEPTIQQLVRAQETFNALSDSEKEAAGNIGGFAQVFESLKGLISTATSALDLFGKALTVIAGSFAVNVLKGIVLELAGIGTTSASALPKLQGLIGLLGKAGLVGAAGAAGVALGSLVKDGIDNLIQSTTGQEGATLGTFIFDLLHSGDNETTTTAIRTIEETLRDLRSGASTELQDILDKLDSLFEKDYGDKTNQTLRSLSTSIGDLSTSQLGDLATQLDNILSSNSSDDEKSQALIDLSNSVLTVDSTVTSSLVGLQRYDDVVEAVAEKSEEGAESTDNFSTEMRKLGLVVDPITGAVSKITTELEKTADAQERASDEARGFKVELIDGVRTYTQVGNSLEVLGKETDNLADKTDNLSEREKIATQNLAEFQLQAAKLASLENIAVLEFSANIRVAEIEADARKVVAAFETIAVGIQSANDLTASLFGELGSASAFDKLGIEAAIRKAQDQADKQLELEELLIKAQVKNLDARTKVINKGGGGVTINADGLADELQAVLKALINNIRVQAINEGLELLT